LPNNKTPHKVYSQPEPSTNTERFPQILPYILRRGKPKVGMVLLTRHPEPVILSPAKDLYLNSLLFAPCSLQKTLALLKIFS